MKKIPAGLAVLLTLCALSCASAPPAPTGPVELDGTKWKLPSSKGRLDGRTVVFKKEGNGYIGYLEDFGLQLRDIPGIRKGMRFFAIDPTGKPNEYFGTYEVPGPDGIPIPQVVSIGVSGNTFTWNLEAGIWERVQ